MFSSLGLFQSLACPHKDGCSRPQCLFSHRPVAPEPSLNIPVHLPIPTSISAPAAPAPAVAVAVATTSRSTIPAKRAASPARRVSAPAFSRNSSDEPPRKLQKVGTSQKPAAKPTALATTPTGAPILRVNAAQSQVAVPVRQAMLKNLYEHFLVLYNSLLPTNPTLAAEHALKQEQEVYSQSTKHTYRNAIIQSIAALKRRDIPTSISHPSVGTEAEVTARAATASALHALRLTRSHLEPYIMSLDQLQEWGYFITVPDGPGGTEPSLEGKVARCERCSQPYQVRSNPPEDECSYHTSKAFYQSISGEKMRIHGCCGKTADDPVGGCVSGPHVFYESKAEDLHLRHPFSFLRPPKSNDETALDVVALDCEMVYTTGGMRVARVSLVDGEGEEIFDELVRMDDGVEVVDYITRWSGISPEEHASKATLTLSSIRATLDIYLNTDTILIGHALDNDLKTLRIVHHKCVDTVVIFPHSAGPPYRRALRDLAREHLNIQIQKGGGSVGHSSVEDSVATLDLVRWHVLNKPKPTRKPPKPEPDVLLDR